VRGTLGAAWSVALLAEISRSLDWDARSATRIVGTSSGSSLAMLLAAGVAPAALLDGQLGTGSLAAYFAAAPRSYPGVRHDDTSFLESLAATYGWSPHLRIIASDLLGLRTALGGSSAPRASLSEALRASWSIPGWFPRVTIEGRSYLDGGVVSPASVDLADGVEEIVVLAPMSSRVVRRRGVARVEGVMRAWMRRRLDAEIAKVRARGVKVLLLEPRAEDLAAFGFNMMDRSRRLAVLEHSLRSARRVVREAAWA
jgi:NTE family protein